MPTSFSAGPDSGPQAAFAGLFGTDALVVMCCILAVAALAALRPVLSLRHRSRRAARDVRVRTRSMQSWLARVRAAERSDNCGVWQYDPQTGAQHVSRGMRMLFGVDPERPFVEGDSETLLAASGVDLVSKFGEAGRSGAGPVTFDLPIRRVDGSMRLLKVEGCRLPIGEAMVVAILRDATAAQPANAVLGTSSARMANPC